MSSNITVTLNKKSNGLSDCPGFKFAATSADIRENDSGQLDLAIITGDKPLKSAAIFTLNDVTAAPVDLCKSILEKNPEKIGGIVVNSGNANACTGEGGFIDAKEMSASSQVNTNIGLPFYVCSTGRIGRKLPIEKITQGIALCSKDLNGSQKNSVDVAKAILTSDTCEKTSTVKISYKGNTITVSGIAKGAGMIEPNMATMLAFLVTDIDASNEFLQKILQKAANKTFNCISIDGDMSTNDTVILLSNGESKISINEEDDLYRAFEDAVYMVSDELAYKIVSDGEKVTKIVKIKVKGCDNEKNAEKIARSIANSLLVKTSFYGSDPNWGRIVDAAGYARVGLEINKLDLSYNLSPVLIGGKVQNQNIKQWKSIVSHKNFNISLNLNLGDAEYSLLTTDLSEAYVDFNKSE